MRPSITGYLNVGTTRLASLLDSGIAYTKKDLATVRITLGENSSGRAATGANGSATLDYLRFQALVTGTSALVFSRSAAYPTELLDTLGNLFLATARMAA
jgi:hypothetical protein